MIEISELNLWCDIVGTAARVGAIVFAWTVIWCSKSPRHVHNWGKWRIVNVQHKWAWEKEQTEVSRQVRQCEECGYVEIANFTD